ncbi:protein LIAT1 [Hemicordylus capensis]|uniref:protein LIAT1 n=1 Tax=Hemicordylus capensis TaxID=884348 RepID=UPI0023022FA3|nr:protein LIAT1 [Hemicordylus capensis]
MAPGTDPLAFQRHLANSLGGSHDLNVCRSNSLAEQLNISDTLVHITLRLSKAALSQPFPHGGNEADTPKSKLLVLKAAERAKRACVIQVPAVSGRLFSNSRHLLQVSEALGFRFPGNWIRAEPSLFGEEFSEDGSVPKETRAPAATVCYGENATAVDTGNPLLLQTQAEASPRDDSDHNGSEKPPPAQGTLSQAGVADGALQRHSQRSLQSCHGDASAREGRSTGAGGRAQHPPPKEELEASGRMAAACRQEPFPDGEGARGSKPLAKEPPVGPQPLGKKKVQRKKKKKKKKKKAVRDDAETPPGKSKQQPVLGTPPLKLLHPFGEDGAPREDATKGRPGKPAGNALFFSASAPLTQGSSAQCNESLRWNGVLDDPLLEEERLWNYRVNRRKRYGAFIQQRLPPEPSLTLKNLPQLCKAAHLSGDHLLCENKPSSPSATASKVQQRPNSVSKLFTKASTSLLPSMSQETV